ncbi:hypothetical protein RhiirC2_162052 [Rhizophagus irregularis]|uniref:Uncharacterized protein n=1 Tax=Rhizophagus irregularis TaxID=588596 RepID=A0A2N1P292_9GLOM|nr:hypothetical protein RhiirC2_162052 [Rhizophagus irregularis]
MEIDYDISQPATFISNQLKSWTTDTGLEPVCVATFFFIFSLFTLFLIYHFLLSLSHLILFYFLFF